MVDRARRREQNRLAAERYRTRHPERRRASNRAYKQRTQEERPIIAIDSEGVDVSDDSHQLVLIGASTGDIVFREDGSGIETRRIFDKLFLPLLMNNRSAIFVSFGFDYDVRMILRDVSAIQWEAIKLHKPTKIMDRNYRVTWTKNRFSVTFLKIPGRPCITIYDVIDFVGSTFVQAVEKYLRPNFDVADAETFDKVIEGKERRNKFGVKDFSYILEYWNSEIGFLPWLVETIRDSITKYLGITVTEWDVATQLTKKMLDKHEVLSFMRAAPDVVPVERAFFGARIEPFYVGRIGEEVWDYDINGAYGYALKWLPNLTTGEWVEISGEDFKWDRDYVPFGIYELDYESWDVGSVLPQPLPVRRGSALLFPPSAHTFVWGPEAWLVREDAEVVRAWVYKDDGTRPLAPLADELWSVRMRMRVDGDPAEKVIKQALARVVGKFCQSFGTEIDYFTGEIVRSPKYRRLEYAGFLTSLTRAQLYQAMDVVTREGGQVYNCNTDGFTSNIDIGKRLEELHGFGEGLGQWKARKYEDLIIIETNMYMLKNYPWHSDDKEWVIKKAGYGPGYKVTIDEIMDELSRDDIWDKDSPMIFTGVQFDDIDMRWITDYKVRHFGGKGKRIHTGNCSACADGLAPSDAPHTLTPRF